MGRPLAISWRGVLIEMCTAITLQTAQGEVFLGRNMDFSHPLDPELFWFPRGYQGRNQSRYHIWGIGQNLGKVILADGVNEAGLAMAALYFPGFAHFPPAGSCRDKEEVPALELVNLLLARCADVSQAREACSQLAIVGVEDPLTRSVAPLHWILTDQSGDCQVLEQTAAGPQFWHNPLGVLSNSPDFPWQLANLRNYVSLSPQQPEGSTWGPVELTPFGQGAGTVGLPGDFTPPARFVRTAYLKSHLPQPAGRDEAVAAGFAILGAAALPMGAVTTARGSDDYTQYTCLLNTATGEYFVRTDDNPQIRRGQPPAHIAGGMAPVSLGRLNGVKASYPPLGQPMNPRQRGTTLQP